MDIGSIEKPLFQVQMKAAGLVPDTIRASDLASLLLGLEGAITETAQAQNILLAYKLDEVLVSLVHIEHGQSSDLTLAVARPVSPVISALTQAIVDRDFTSLPFGAQDHLHKLSLHAISKRWAYEFHSVNGLLVAPAVISYEYPVPKPTMVALTSGKSTIWGHLIKVGGDNDPRAVMRFRNGKWFSARVTQKIVIDIVDQNLIYKDIGLRGTATWRIDDWSLIDFKADSITDYRPDETNLVDTFRTLADVSGMRWENIDATDFVKNLRSEEE